MRWNGSIIGKHMPPSVGNNSGVYDIQSAGFYHKDNKWSNTALAGWDPASMGTDLQMWYDFSDSSVITESDGIVSRVEDKGPRNMELTVFPGSTGPSVSASTINGVNVLHFDGDNLYNEVDTNEELTHSTTNPLYLTTMFQIVTMKYQFFWALRSSTQNPRITLRTSTGQLEVLGSSGQNHSHVSVGEPFIFTVKMAETECQTYLNGTLGDDQFTISRTIMNDLHIGTNEQDSQYADALYGDFMIYRGDDTTRKQVDGYLAHKWGLTSNLPDGHPYKTSAPNQSV